MSDIEFIGFISNNNSSETIVRNGPVLDPVHIETVAKAHANADAIEYGRELGPATRALIARRHRAKGVAAE